jgi:nitrate reductase NapAB chaperone NapD
MTTENENTAPKSKSSELLGTVAEKIGASGPAIRERVIDTLVEREVAARTDVLDKALAKRSEIGRELQKLQKPDVEAYDVEGKLVSATFSKARTEELKKKREEQERLEKAIDKALVDNDFAKLKEIVAK